jgi:4-hydroxy-tetrahydrodipicolinate synthase
MPMKLSGVYAVLPTPFDENGSFDRESLGRVIDCFLSDGVSGFTALGVASEVARLTDQERQLVLEATMRFVDGRRPVIVGATGSALHTCLGYCADARDSGAAGLMVSPPPMSRLNSDAVLRHFASIAGRFDLPIVVQDYPPITGYHLEPSLLVELCREIPSARAIKVEDPPTPSKIARMRDLGKGLGIDIVGGLGGAYLLEELIAGAQGTMTGFAYPGLLVEVVSKWMAGKKEAAADFFYRHVPLIRFEAQEAVGMAIRKEILRRRGVLKHATIRQPGAILDPSTMEGLDRILRFLELA